MCGEKGQRENCVHLECLHTWTQGGRVGSGASGADMVPPSHFGKGMRCTGRAHKICACCHHGRV